MPPLSPAGPAPTAKAVSLQAGLLATLCLGLYGWQMWRYGIIQDDAYISLVYARNLADGLGFVFNPGERVEGYTNFLWTLLLAVPHLLGLDAARTAQILGAVCGLLVTGAGWGLGRELAPRRPLWTTSWVPLLLAGNGALAFWSLSGLETSLFTLLVTGAAWRYLRRGRLEPGSCLLLALATLTRPEGAMFAVVTGAHQLVGRDRSLRRLLRHRDTRRGLALAFGLVLPHLLFRFLYYGELLPNTFYAKTGISATHLDHGLRYVGKFLGDFGFGGLVLFAAAWLCRLRRAGAAGPPAAAGRYVAALIAICLAYAVAVGGDTMAENRLLLPVLPFTLVAVQTAGADVLAGPPRRRRLWIPLTAAALGWTLWVPHTALLHARQATAAHNDKLQDLVTYMQGLPRMPELVASTAIGIPRYFTGAAVLDLVGLTDATIARRPRRLPGIRDDHLLRNYETAYALNRAPQLIYFITGARPATPAERALFLSSRFRNDYVLRYRRDDRPLYVLRREPPAHAADDLYSDGRFIELYSDGLATWTRDPVAARALLRACAAVAPGDFEDVHYWLGRLAYEEGDDEAARASLEHVLRLDDEHAMAQAHLAAVELRSGDPARALSHARRARALSPPSHFAAYILGRALLASGRETEAIAALRDAAQLPGRSTVDAMFHLGVAYQRRGDLGTARRVWEAVLAVDSTHVRARDHLRRLYP